MVIVALIISIIGNIINAWGMIAMKIGHEKANAEKMKVALQEFMDMQEAAERSGSKTAGGKPLRSSKLSSAFLKEPFWWLGMTIYTTGSLMHVASLGFGPSALLNPMEGLTLVANALSAPFMLGESLTKIDMIGTAVIVLGISVVILFGPHSEVQNTMDELLDRFDGCTPSVCNHGFLIWSVSISVITVICWLGAVYLQYKNEKEGIYMDGSLKPRGATFLALTFTNIKGVIGGFTMLFGKIVMEALDGGYVGRWETYMFIFFFVVCNVGMEYWRQKALNVFSAMYCVPLMQVSLVIFSVMSGGIFFSEFKTMSAWRVVIFAVGVGIICVGVGILSAVSENRKRKSPWLRFKAACIAIWSIFRLQNLVKRSKGGGQAAVGVGHTVGPGGSGLTYEKVDPFSPSPTPTYAKGPEASPHLHDTKAMVGADISPPYAPIVPQGNATTHVNVVATDGSEDTGLIAVDSVELGEMPPASPSMVQLQVSPPNGLPPTSPMSPGKMKAATDQQDLEILEKYSAIMALNSDLDPELLKAMVLYFDRYDLDESGNLNDSTELCQLCINLAYYQKHNMRVSDVITLKQLCDAEELNDYNAMELPAFISWFRTNLLLT